LKFLSVCSGIEAASVAWSPLGWRAVAFAEIEPFPCAVLAHHYPDVPNFGDMTKYKDWPDVSIDILCGGTPCQSFSVAGLRKGLDDPRGNLMLTFGAIAAKYRPRWLVWENVPGVLSSNGGRDFGSFLGMLGQLGYGFAYRVLDAQYAGLAQRRKRVFVVGCLGDWRRAAAVLFERHSLQWNPAPRREARQTAPTIPSRSTAGGGLGTDFDCDGGLVQTGHLIAPEVARCDATREGSSQDWETTTMIAHSLTGEVFDASEDGTGRGTPLVPIAFSAKDHGADASDDLSPTLRAGGHAGSHANAGVMPAVAFTTKMHNTASNNAGKIFEERSTCLDANSPPPALLMATQVRRLTPVECLRLQGFPDDYLDITYRGKPAADGPKYKAIGNSWAVPVVRWIGERIEQVEAVTAQLEAA
jgi:DNA (cytosine-5)-methyltransferase 1